MVSLKHTNEVDKIGMCFYVALQLFVVGLNQVVGFVDETTNKIPCWGVSIDPNSFIVLQHFLEFV